MFTLWEEGFFLSLFLPYRFPNYQPPFFLPKTRLFFLFYFLSKVITLTFILRFFSLFTTLLFIYQLIKRKKVEFILGCLHLILNTTKFSKKQKKKKKKKKKNNNNNNTTCLSLSAILCTQQEREEGAFSFVRTSFWEQNIAPNIGEPPVHTLSNLFFQCGFKCAKYKVGKVSV